MCLVTYFQKAERLTQYWLAPLPQGFYFSIGLFHVLLQNFSSWESGGEELFSVKENPKPYKVSSGCRNTQQEEPAAQRIWPWLSLALTPLAPFNAVVSTQCRPRPSFHWACRDSPGTLTNIQENQSGESRQCNHGDSLPRFILKILLIL